MSELTSLRSDPKLWSTVEFCPPEVGPCAFDSNQMNRKRVLLLLQYDRRPSDLELIRFLFTQEVRAAERLPIKECTTMLMLSAVLLGAFREPLDVDLFIRAFYANRNTQKEFPVEFISLVAGGRSPAWGALPEHYAIPTKEELLDWWININLNFPSSPESDHPFLLCDRAFFFGQLEKAAEYLEKYRCQEVDSELKYRNLKNWYARLKRPVLAAEACVDHSEFCQQVLQISQSLSEAMYLFHDANLPHSIYGTALRFDQLLSVEGDTERLMIEPFAIGAGFDLCQKIECEDTAGKLFSLADHWFQRRIQTDLHTGGLGESAARRFGFEDIAKHYRDHDNSLGLSEDEDQG